MRAHAVIFDFNGTLSDDERLLNRLYRELFAAEGIALSSAEYDRDFAGRPDPEVIRTVLEQRGGEPSEERVAELLRRKVQLYKQEIADESPVQPEVSAFVHAVAARVPIAIASSALREEVECVLEQARLTDKFQAIVCLEDVENGKPAPDGYRAALDQLNDAIGGEQITADQVVVFEDSTVGVQAALAAGMRCIAIEGPAYDAETGGAAATVRGLCAVEVDKLLG